MGCSCEGPRFVLGSMSAFKPQAATELAKSAPQMRRSMVHDTYAGLQKHHVLKKLRGQPHSIKTNKNNVNVKIISCSTG